MVSSLPQMGMFVFLFVCALTDLRKKSIPVLLLGVGIALDVWLFAESMGTIRQVGFEVLLQNILFSLFPGFCIWILSGISESVGPADGLLLMMVGLAFGWEKILAAICIALLVMSVLSIVLLALRLVHRHTRIPFAPFLFAALLFVR